MSAGLWFWILYVIVGVFGGFGGFTWGWDRRWVGGGLLLLLLLGLLGWGGAYSGRRSDSRHGRPYDDSRRAA